MQNAVSSRQLQPQEIKPFAYTAHPTLSPSSEISPLVNSPTTCQTVPQSAGEPYCQPTNCQPQGHLRLFNTLQVQDFARSVPKSIEPLDVSTIIRPMASRVNDEGYASGYTSESSDTSSIDPSLFDFVRENGRRYHSNSCFPETLF